MKCLFLFLECNKSFYIRIQFKELTHFKIYDIIRPSLYRKMTFFLEWRKFTSAFFQVGLWASSEGRQILGLSKQRLHILKREIARTKRFSRNMGTWYGHINKTFVDVKAVSICKFYVIFNTTIIKCHPRVSQLFFFIWNFMLNVEWGKKSRNIYLKTCMILRYILKSTSINF